MKNRLIQIEARVGRVKLNDAVHQWSADTLIDEIERLYGEQAVEARMQVCGFVAVAENALETLHFEINSPGGNVSDGYRIFHELERMKARGVRVVATINGQAASMATVIAMAADHINITRGSLMLIHDARTTTSGTAEEHRRAANTLEDISNEIATLYAARTGRSTEDMRALMDEDRWMTAKEAKELGLVDEIISGASASAQFDFESPERKMGADMNIFQSRKELQEVIESLKTDLASAEASAESFESAVREAQEKAKAETEARIEAESAAVSKIAALEAQVSERDEVIAKAQEEFSAHIERLESEVEAKTAELEEAKRLAAVQATAEVAAAGHPPVDVEDDAEQAAGHLAKFESLSGAEAAEYYRKHRKEIRAEMRSV